jgi:sec-independent protein translocase protein TatC
MFLKKYRKHSIVGVLVLSAVITPPDALAQILVAIPILLLYELGIFVSGRVYRKKKAAEVANNL